jgi:uncharacterized protein
MSMHNRTTIEALPRIRRGQPLMEKRMRETIANALKDACRVSTLRLIQATLKDRDIANRGVGKGPVETDELLQILAKMIKQREESAKIFAENGRPELAAQEREEIKVIEGFLPEQISEGKMKDLIAAAIAEIGAQGLRDMGKVMAVLKERYPGQMDFAKASGVVKDLLK